MDVLKLLFFCRTGTLVIKNETLSPSSIWGWKFKKLFSVLWVILSHIHSQEKILKKNPQGGNRVQAVNLVIIEGLRIHKNILQEYRPKMWRLSVSSSRVIKSWALQNMNGKLYLNYGLKETRTEGTQRSVHDPYLTGTPSDTTKFMLQDCCLYIPPSPLSSLTFGITPLDWLILGGLGYFEREISRET